jgi:hypothetical protein
MSVKEEALTSSQEQTRLFFTHSYKMQVLMCVCGLVFGKYIHTYGNTIMKICTGAQTCMYVHIHITHTTHTHTIDYIYMYEQH